MTTLYGISNCDTVKRARRCLEDAGLAYRFHDFRRDGLDPALARQWLEYFGAQRLINRRGTTWRALSPTEQSLDDLESLTALLLRSPSLIKRPVIEHLGQWRIGFARQEQAEILRWLGQTPQPD